MTTSVSEVADGIFQVRTYLEAIDFGLNQYLVLGDEPLLFHTGMNGLFDDVSAAVREVLDPAALRWISFGHVEADECGSMNRWLAAAPSATIVQGNIGCMVSIGDLADRPPRPLADGETLDIGGHVLRWLDTPHVPHAWEAGLLFDETTATLFCGDLFSQFGDYPSTTDDDIVGAAVAGEDAMPSMSLHPASAATLRRLGDLGAHRLAPMHAPVFTGDVGSALDTLADDVERRTRLAA